MMRVALIGCLLFAFGCGGDGLDSCGVSVGTCNQNSQSCGAQFACKGKTLALRCAPPPAGTTVMECTCVDNGVLGKTVQIEAPLRGDARAVASSACGWPR